MFTSKFAFRAGLVLLAILSVVPLCGSVTLQDPPEPDEKQVQAAIAKGIAFLKSQQRDGKWEKSVIFRSNSNYPGGVTALAMAALLEAGVKPDDEAIAKGIEFVRKLPPRDTYVVALQTLVLSQVDPKKDLKTIQRNVEWIKQTLKRDRSGNLNGWSYPGRGFETDNSNTQFAVFALHVAARAGAEVDERLWREIRFFYVQSQLSNGGWQYRASSPIDRLAMTSAGICGLLIAANHLPDKDPASEKAIARGLERVDESFTIEYPKWRFYNLWCLARRNRLLGKTAFNGRKASDYDWYRMGTEYLLKTQSRDGSWQSEDEIDGHPLVATSFALLFFGKR